MSGKYIGMLCFSLMFCSRAFPEVVIYPIPDEIPSNKEWSMTVNGMDCPVYNVKVEPDIPYKNNDGTIYEVAGMSYFDFEDDSVNIEITLHNRPFSSALIRPLTHGIVPVINGNTICFSLTDPCQFVVELDNSYFKPLHVFANPVEENPITSGSENVEYYGPGVHQLPDYHVVPRQDYTIYISGGSYVYCDKIVCKNDNITIRGRGILCGEKQTEKSATINVRNQARNFALEGIIVLDAYGWVTWIRDGASDFTITNYKMINYRQNTDGIDIVDAQNCVIKDCFIRTWDDGICIKKHGQTTQPRNILVENCIVWVDWGWAALEIGTEIQGDNALVSDVTFSNCALINSKPAPLSIYNRENALVENIRYKNIHIEAPRVKDPHNPSKNTLVRLKIEYNTTAHSPSTAVEMGNIRDIYYENINIIEAPYKKVTILGFDRGHCVRNVTFNNLVINGDTIKSREDIILDTNRFAYNINFITDATVDAPVNIYSDSFLSNLNVYPNPYQNHLNIPWTGEAVLTSKY